MRGIQVAVLAAGLLVGGVASATTSHTISFTAGGPPDCTAWASDERFAGNDTTQTLLTWDADNVYVAWQGGDKADRRLVAFDVDVGDSSDTKSFSYAGVGFGPDAQPELIVELTAGTVTVSTYSSSIPVSVVNPTGVIASGYGTCVGTTNSQTFVELKIARTLFPSPSLQGLPSATPIGMVSWFDSGTLGVYGAMPTGSCAPPLSSVFDEELYVPTTDDKRSPNTYALPGDVLGYQLQVPQSPMTYGLATYTVTLTPPSCANGALATGSVNFTDGNTVLVGPLNGGIATVNELPSVGSHTIVGSYPGSLGPSATGMGILPPTVPYLPVFGQQDLAVVAAATQMQLESSANPAVYGEPVTITATLMSNGGTAPTGEVDFVLGSQTIRAVLVDNGDGTSSASFDLPLLDPGTYPIQATYVPFDNNFTGSSSDLSQEIDQALTTTILSSSSNPSTTGAPITLTVTVSTNDPGGGVPAGTITISEGGTTLLTTKLDANGQATLQITPTTGTHTYSASYGGSIDHVASTAEDLVQVVDPASATVSMTISPSPGVYGNAFTISVTVTGGNSTPTGSVDVAGVGGITLDGSGQGQIAVPGTIPAGTNLFSAAYSGDGNYGATKGTASVAVAPADSLVSLAAAPNPALEGSQVTLTAKVVAANGFTATRPGGAVTFKDGPIPIGTVHFNGAGNTVVLQANALGLGTHAISAAFTGDDNLNAGTSAAADVTVVSPYDAGVRPDATLPDAGTDAQVTDAAPIPDVIQYPDARRIFYGDAAAPDAGSGGKSGGCGCSVGSRSPRNAPLALLLLGMLALCWRRSR